MLRGVGIAFLLGGLGLLAWGQIEAGKRLFWTEFSSTAGRCREQALSDDDIALGKLDVAADGSMETRLYSEEEVRALPDEQRVIVRRYHSDDFFLSMIRDLAQHGAPGLAGPYNAHLALWRTHRSKIRWLRIGGGAALVVGLGLLIAGWRRRRPA